MMFRVAHLTTVDMSLRFLVLPQLTSVDEAGGEAIGISSPGPWVGELEELGISHIPLKSSTRGANILADVRSAAELWRVLRTANLTVLHTHNPKPGLYGRVLGRLAGVPVVINTVHGLYATQDDPILKRALVYSLEWVASRFSDLELYQNPEDLDLARAMGLTPAKKSRLLGNGVDLSRFDPESVDPGIRDALRAEWGASPEDVVVGVVGRLVAEKGFPELFEAAARMPSKYVFVVAGPEDPDKADALSRDEIERAAAGGVRFLGMRSDVKELYSAMDVFCLPSHREGFPRAAMEAAAMGLPIIATNIRGCRQVVDEGVNGHLVAVRSADSLVAAITALGDSVGARGRMGAASAALARERFDERRVVDIVMSGYREVMAAKGLSHLWPAPDVPSLEPTRIRPAVSDDARSLANMHSDHIDTGFLRLLGRRFMRVLYQAIIDWPDSVALVADDRQGPVGFVAGVTDTGAFYRRFARRYWLRAGLAALPRLLAPHNLRRAWETLSYGRGGEVVAAELLSMAVAGRARRQGLSLRLGAEFVDGMRSRGIDAIRVVVGSENGPAIGAYRRMGFEEAHRVEVHQGETSEVMIWRS